MAAPERSGRLNRRRVGFLTAAAGLIFGSTLVLFPDPVSTLAGLWSMAGSGASHASAIAVLSALLGVGGMNGAGASHAKPHVILRLGPEGIMVGMGPAPADVLAAIGEVREGRFTAEEKEAFGPGADLRSLAWQGMAALLVKPVRTFQKMSEALYNAFRTAVFWGLQKIRGTWMAVEMWLGWGSPTLKRVLHRLVGLLRPAVSFSGPASDLPAGLSFVPAYLKYCSPRP